MKLGIIQFDILWENAPGNIEKIQQLTDHLKPGDLDLLVLPELWPVGFTMNHDAWRSFDIAVAAMHNLSKKLECSVLGGLPHPVEDGQENRCYLVEGDQRRYYSKIKVFKFAGEHLKYKEGDARKRWDLHGFQLSPFICYDLRFPELPRPMVPETNLISYVACWPKTRVHHWRALLQARAIENLSYVIGCNRVGRDGAGLDYVGSSMVIGPKGEIVLDCGDTEGLFQCEINPEDVAQARQDLPFLNDI